MIFTKEKDKLDELLISASNIDVYNESEMEILNESYKQYSLVIKSLYKRNPNVFGNLHNYDLTEIKNNKKFTKESFSEAARQTNFLVYRDSIVDTVEKTIQYITDFV